MSEKGFADWRLIRVREDGTPIVRPICPRCKHDLNNASYCTECGQEFGEDDKELQQFFRAVPADPGDGVSGRRAGERRVVSMIIFDECEIHTNCTVQILHNSVTDEYSIGWWKNE